MTRSRSYRVFDGNHIGAGFCGMILTLLSVAPAFAAGTYDLTFSTYFGGSNWEHARDIAVDRQGNMYVVGGASSEDFPTTPSAYSRTIHAGGSQEFGPCDVFVTKFAPDGRLLWSTLIGGPYYDRGYGVEVDGQGFVYVAGRAGPGFPVKNAFQPDFNGVDNGSYGMQNAFVLKLAPDGSDLVWASYVGVSTLCRDIAIDPNGDVYVPGGRWNTTKAPPAAWFANAFLKDPPGQEECGAIKIKGDGSRVLWATWLGGSGQDSAAASIRVGRDGKVYVGSSTFSEDFPTTPGAHDRTYNGQADFFVTCLTPDGSSLVYGTYLGGDGNEWISTHNLAVDDAGNAYVAVPTASSNYPVTAGAFQTSHHGGGTDWAISKFSPIGALLASTLVGGSGSENADGVYVDSAGNVFVTGETQSTDFPTTATAFQGRSGGGSDAAVVLLSPDFQQLLYSTYLGGPANDNGRSGFLGSNGCLYVVGASDGPGWPARNAYQGTFAGGGGQYGNGDCILARLAPAPAGGDLLGHWKFDEGQGSTAADSSDYGHDGTVVQATWATGKTGFGLDFAGFGNYVQISAGRDLDNLEAITMAAWICPRVDSHWHVLDKGDGHKRIYADGINQTLNGRVRYTGAHAYSASISGTVTLGVWQHVAMTWSRTTGTTRLYRNGVEVAYAVQEIGSGSPLDDSPYPFIIGARGALGEATFFNGLMDEVRLYNRALSKQETANLSGSAGPPRR